MLVSVAPFLPPGSYAFGNTQKGLRAVDNPERLPLTFVRPLSTALPICSLTVLATPFPRKSRHRSRCEAPPPKHFATFVSEPDPNYFTFCLTLSCEALAMCVPTWLSAGLQCFSFGFTKGIELGNQRSAKVLQKSCKSSIQTGRSFALKSLAAQKVARASCA